MPYSPRSRQLACAAIAVTLTGALLHTSALPREACYMAGIFTLAALLWVSEALPLFATALLVIALEILLLANPGGWPGLGFEQGRSPSFQQILVTAVDPVLVLFFGSFMLARATIKAGVDNAVAALMLAPCRGRPELVLFGLMAATACFSMWMSNSATAAMMLALLAPLLASLPADERFRSALVLGVAFSANIGGIGTPIGSPPNAVALGHLRAAGVPLGFLEWMALALPIVLVLLLLTWWMLWQLYRPRQRAMTLKLPMRAMHPQGRFVIAVFSVTVALWVTEALHGLPAAVVALLPALAFTACGLIGREDVDRLEWNILILIGGGLALGAGMQMTELDQAIAGALGRLSGAGNTSLQFALLALTTLALSTFISNTAAANLLLPIAVALAGVSGMPGAGAALVQGALCVAFTASASMSLPVSTPPNAIAYAQGVLNTRDMLLPGIAIGLLMVALVAFGSGPVLRMWGFGA